MNTQLGSRSRRFTWATVPVPGLTLAFCAFYTLICVFSGATHSGVSFDGQWVVTHIDLCDTHPGWCEANQEGLEALRVGDRLVAVGDLTYEKHGDDRLVVLFSGYAPDEAVPVTLSRSGAQESILWRMPAITAANRAQHLASLLSCLPFWLAGTAIFLFLRPRDVRWRLLVAFNYLTAGWLVVGMVSPSQLAASSLVLHALSWLMVPVYLHLHHLVPVPLTRRQPRRFMVSVYAIAGVLAVLELGQLLPRSAYLLGFFLGVAGSLALLVSRLFVKSSTSVRQAVRLMLAGVGLAFGPGVAFWLTPSLLRVTAPGETASAIATLSIPVLPLFYTYAIYKRYLGDLEFRASRVMGLYSFIMLYATAFVLVFQIGARSLGLSRESIGFNLAVSTLFVIAGPLALSRFRRSFDRLVYGTSHNPDEILRLFASRIAAAMDHEALGWLLGDEIAPVLLVRQSSLCLLASEEVSVVYERGVERGGTPSTLAQVRRLLEQTGQYRPPQEQATGAFDWVRLTVPLETREKLVGIWCFGRRDPDDYYPQNDVALLTTLASQAAVAVENAHLYELAQQEIAERTRAEMALRESEQKYRGVVDNANEAILVIQDGRLVFANPRAAGMAGVAVAGLIDRPIGDLVHPDDREAVLGQYERVISGDCSFPAYLFRIVDQAGGILWIEANAVQITWEGMPAILSFLNDVTERVSLEGQLRHAMKMESIGRLAGGVAHDFNNLLTAITGYAGLMQSELPDSDPMQEYVAYIQGASDRAASLTAKLLAFSRKQIIEPQIINLNLTVQDTQQILGRVIGEDIEMEVNLAPDLWMVKMDPSQTEQVIINLAINARDAMPRGGVLTIATENVLLDEDYVAQHVGAEPGEHVKLTIRDNGVGMTDEAQAHLFEPFFTTKEEGKGTGLGLATVYGIVKQGGGHIWCDTERGVGTSFEIYLPRETEQALEVAWLASEGKVPDGSETILLVEDEDSVRKLASRVLGRAGYTILAAEDADVALEFAREYSGVIHLVVTDVVMPRVSGSALIEELTSILPGVKVLYMSGYTDDAVVHRGAMEPGTSFIQKPFSPSGLARKVREVLESR